MFNVDRWAYYTRQKSISLNGPWVDLTPRQRRRCIKKSRKNNDYSIGITRPFSVSYINDFTDEELTRYFGTRDAAEAFRNTVSWTECNYTVGFEAW